MQYPSAKGVFDILPLEVNPEDKWKESSRWQFLEEVMRQTAHEYGYLEIRTPIFERTELFIRGVGESSDIVSKEMYSFLDRGERSITLRPEGTAPFIRSFVEHQLYSQQTLHKYYYFGPMFRYERPQAGRYRQFHQFGAEAIGKETPEQDVELIDLFHTIYHRLGLKNLNVQINSIGDVESRNAYKRALSDYLQPYLSMLSAESQIRFSKNILRILDSKNLEDQKILENAPVLSEFLSPASHQHFRDVIHYLETLKIKHTINPKLVRGLDYYTQIVFEITSGELGAQNAIGGGGRYDGLIAEIGGPALPAVGCATGMERILLTMLKQNAAFPTPPHPLVFFIPMGVEARSQAFKWVCTLRHEHIPCDIDLSGKKMQHGLQMANQLQAKYSIIVGENELKSGQVTIKTMATRETTSIELNQLISTIKKLKQA